MPCGYCSETTKRTLFMVLKITGELALVAAIASVFVIAAQGRKQEVLAEQNSGREYMRTLNEATRKMKNKLAVTSWDYESNMTKHNEDIMLQVSLEAAEEEKELWKETMTYLWREFEDEDLKRMFKKYSVLGMAALPEDLNQRFIQAVTRMKNTYAKATICDYQNKQKCDLHLEPEITNIIQSSNDAEELKHAWVEWHKAAGTPSKKDFSEYVSLYTSAAKSNGFETVADWWLSEYEVSDIEDQFAELWSTIKPFYDQLHAYVRRQLRLKYGDNVVSAKGPIPSHLLGNMWAQSWESIEDFTRPYPGRTEIDITGVLVQKNYTAQQFFKTAEEFFTSLNLMKMTDTFWAKSIIEKPADGRDLVCHASAWDFFNGDDVRIKQCTSITSDFFTTTHHEMGHIQYYLQYADLPTIYRTGANPGFHEAVGDVIALSVSSPKHLEVMGLLENAEESMESNINQLYKMALSKVVFLPFGYMLDLYRYSIFRGTTSPDNYNCHFWKYRENFQGLEPPVPRTEQDFDPAAKYHVSADVEYMRYYVSYIIQFQFHRALCQLADQYTPGNDTQLLFNCDIYKNAAAGDALGKMLRMGASKPWPEAMEVMTGQQNMDAKALLEYFQPLHDWLKAENEKTGEFVGWEGSKVEYCTPQQLQQMKDSEFQKKLKRQMGQ